MSEVTREIVHDKRGASSVLTWLAVLLSVAALALAWMAYNRAGQDLESRIQDQVNRSVNSVQNETPNADNN